MLTSVQQQLQRATPESQGIASSAIRQFVEAVEEKIREFHSFMLLRHGKVVAEGWWSPYKAEHPHMLFSLSKSFTSTAVGLAVNEGLFSLDDPVISFFPDDLPAEVSENLAAMHVRHLLSMSTGHDIDTTQPMVEHPEFNWARGVLGVPVVHEPGTHFLYNTGATYMLSAIVQKTSGQKLVDYLEPRLFQPLGIENATWDDSPQGINTGGFGLKIRTEDIARFGQLYLQKGVWEGRHILPEAWVEEATRFQIANEGFTTDWEQGYGYQFWRCTNDCYRGDGAFGQYCVVMPKQDAVIAITGGLGDMQPPLDLVWNILLPAMGAEALSEDAGTHEALTQKLSGLRLLPVQGKSSSPIAAGVSGKTYKVEANEFKLDTLTLEFTDSGCTVHFKTKSGTETIACGFGVWEKGYTALFNEWWVLEPTHLYTSGAWTADDTFTMVFRMYETPFYETMAFHFDGDQVLIETLVNVGFATPKPRLMTARAK
jgi:CubicO group peptidase (beta-lactamase class C family)